MINLTSKFKAKLILIPNTKDKELNVVLQKNLTVGKKYYIHAVFDMGQEFTDFLIADNEGIFRWINASCFRGK